MPEAYLNETLEIYIDYRRLKASEFSRYLNNLAIVAAKISEDYFARFNDYGEEEPPTLDIETIATGNSIKCRLVEGWKPSVKSGGQDGTDIIIGIPEKLGVPLVVGHLLVAAAFGYLQLRNMYLDNKLKEKELLETKVVSSIPNTEETRSNTYVLIANYVNKNIPEIQPVLLDTVKSVLGNPDIVSFKVNNVEIKNIKNQ